MFCDDIDQAAKEYEARANRLLLLQGEGWELLSGEKKRDLRKKVNQAARSRLPNETETIITVSGNVRAWRNFLDQRANSHAEVEIRRVAVHVYDALAAVSPLLFSDYKAEALPDGTMGLSTPYRKI